MMQKAIIHYIGCELVEGGFVRNDDWVREHVSAAASLFTDQNLKIAAGVIAAINERAIDYIRQCPALVLALLVFRHQSRNTSGTRYLSPLSFSDVRKDLAALACDFLAPGPKLKQVMAEIGLCPAQRAIHGYALTHDLDCWQALRLMPGLKPSVLAQAIPEHIFDQITWMRDLEAWVGTFERLSCDAGWQFEWAVRNLGDRFRQAKHSANVGREVSADTLADYIAQGENADKFNPAWDRTRFAQVVLDWHHELQSLNAEKREAKRQGRNWEEPCDYGSLPISVDIDGLSFVALRSGKELFEEGRKMRHCVSSYTRDVMKGDCRIYGVRSGMARLATLEIRQIEGAWSNVQFKGKCNARPEEPGWQAAEKFLHIINGGAA